MSATALGTGAVIVVAAGLGVSIARTGDEGAVQPSADSAPALPGASATPTASPSPTAPAPTHGQRHHSDVPGAGRNGRGNGAAGHGGSSRHQTHPSTPGPTDLPYTGSVPLPATTALGLLLALAGSWTLVRVPGLPGEVQVVVVPGALDRLRAPRRVTG